MKPRATCTHSQKPVFVADFVGTSNVINGELAQQITGNNQPFSIRPEHIVFDNTEKDSHTFSVNGTIVDVQYQGAHSKISLNLNLIPNLNLAQQTIALVLSNTEYNEAELPKVGNRLNVLWLKSNMVML